MINKNFLLLFKNKSSIADKLNIDLRKRPGELSNEDYYNIAKEIGLEVLIEFAVDVN